MRKHTIRGRICRAVVRKRAITAVVPGQSCLKVSLRCVLNFPVWFRFNHTVVFGELSRKEAFFFLSFFLYFFFSLLFSVNPCPCYLGKGYIVKAAYLGGVVRTGSLSGSPRPLGDSFTVQMTLRERSMEKLKNQNQIK